MRFLIGAILFFAIASANFCPDDDSVLTPWSTWSGKPTGVNETVTIPAGSAILVDESTPLMYKLLVRGQLIFKRDANITMRAYLIYVYDGGLFQVGCVSCPATGNIDIVLYGRQALNYNPDGLGSKVLGAFPGGTINLHGVLPSPTWTNLAANANKGDKTITVRDSVDWKVGDKIVVATTDYERDPSERTYTQNEVFTITSRPTPTSIGLSGNFSYNHYGKIFSQNGQSIDMAAEVGLLTRNVRVYGDVSDDSMTTGWGSHIMIMRGADAHISGIETFNAGQAGEKGRYPIHFHLYGPDVTSYVVGNSIHDTFQRCLTLHGAENVIVKDNVAYNGTGHCFFIEDGNERNNIIQHNLGISPRIHNLLGSDEDPAVFWITNPLNHFYDNVAVGGHFGYWYAMPEVPTGPVAPPVTPAYQFMLRYWEAGDFDGNKAHSASESGVFVDRGQQDDAGNANQLTSYYPSDWSSSNYLVSSLTSNSTLSSIINSFDEYSLSLWGKPSPLIISDFTGYKCSDRAIWGRGANMWVDNAKMADNRAGITFPGLNNLVTNSLFIGETDNVGNPNCIFPGCYQWWPNEEGRSRPYKWWIDVPIFGYTSYDASGGDITYNNVFMNFNDYQFVNTTNWNGKPPTMRMAGAFSGLPGPNVIEPTNKYYKNTYYNVGNRVSLQKYSSPDSNGNRVTDFIDDAMKGWVTVDADGTLTGSCGAQVVGNSPLVRNSTCVQQAAWNAYVCPAGFIPNKAFYINTDSSIFMAGGTNTTALYMQSMSQVYRMSDAATVSIFGDLKAYTSTSNYAYYNYGTNLLTNQDYLWTVSGKTPTKFTVSVGTLAQGEYFYFALPFPSGTTFNITVGWSSTQIPAAASKAALNGTNWFYDSTNKLLWVKLVGSSIYWDYPYGIPQLRNSDARMTITANCGGPSMCTQAIPTIGTMAALSNPAWSGSRNLCENNGPVQTQTTTVTSPTPYNLFTGGALQNGFALQTVTAPNVPPCKVVNGTGPTGEAAINCVLWGYASAGYSTYTNMVRSGPTASAAAYTHIAMDIRSAPTFGNIYVRMGLINSGWSQLGWVSLANPKWTKTGITESWQTIYVPITEFGTTPASLNIFGFQWIPADNQYLRPISFYLANVKYVTASSVGATWTFPPQPVLPAPVATRFTMALAERNPENCNATITTSPPLENALSSASFVAPAAMIVAIFLMIFTLF